MSKYTVITLSQELIKRQSITPDDAGCQLLLTQLLSDVGFQIEHKRFGEVDNLFAWHGQDSDNSKSLLFAGHTDVVPTGDENAWTHPPFSAVIDGDYLYGRGAADMKSAVAAFTLAMIDFVKNEPNHKGKIALMLTSDEEGVATDGIKKMMPYIAKNHKFDFALVGEPSSSQTLGDVVRIGRRGSLHCEITVHGIQGHVAYPQNAQNPVFLAAPFIEELSQFNWDNGNNDFPPTSFQISSVKTSSNTANIIPADMIINANFRYCPESSKQSLKQQIEQLLNKHSLQYSLSWNLSGLPFYSQSTHLHQAVYESIYETRHIKPDFNTAGGTSDGRFIAQYGIDVVELGVINKTIHQIDECALTKDIMDLEKIYQRIITKLL
jgi:succinyl-diaminopimelate desuccinylase